MTTPVRFTGFNPEVVSQNGGGLFDTVSATPTIVTATDPFGNSAPLLEIAASAAVTRARWTLATPNVVVYSFYVKFPSALPGADVRVCVITGTDAVDCYLKYVNATQKWGIQWQGGATATWGGAAINVNQWYKIDLRCTFNVNPHTCDWQIDGAVQTQNSSPAAVGSTGATAALGTSATDTYTARYAYPVVSTTSGDYPIPDRVVRKALPTSDGTHSPATPDCIRGGGGSPALISGSNAAYQYMDDATFPSGTSPTTDRISQDISTSHTTHYVEMNVGGFSSSGGTLQGVMALLAYGGDSATSNNGTTKVLNNEATSQDIFSGDMSETTVFYKQVLVTVPSGGWDDSKVNGCKFRVGFSTDISPNPFWQALMLEVMYFPGAAANTKRSFGVVIG